MDIIVILLIGFLGIVTLWLMLWEQLDVGGFIISIILIFILWALLDSLIDDNKANKEIEDKCNTYYEQRVLLKDIKDESIRGKCLSIYEKRLEEDKKLNNIDNQLKTIK